MSEPCSANADWPGAIPSHSLLSSASKRSNLLLTKEILLSLKKSGGGAREGDKTAMGKGVCCQDFQHEFNPWPHMVKEGTHSFQPAVR